VAPLRGWLSTLVAAGILTALLGAFAAVRIMADHSAQTEASPPDSLDTSTAAVEAVSPSVAQPARETSPVQQLASRPVRFSAKPIEPSYTVQAGDSLSAIAQRSNTTADAIQAINNLPDRSVLSVGQRLVIP
jgi:LysM repeat protein